MTKFLKKIVPFLILVSFLILSALLPEILGEEAKVLSQNYLGKNYKYILVAFFILLSLFAVYLRPEIGMGLFLKRSNTKSAYYDIPGTFENRELLHNAKKAFSNGDFDKSLKHLSDLPLKTLDIEISMLRTRLAQFQHTQREGILSASSEIRELNRINRDILGLIKTLEIELNNSSKYYDEVRGYLKQRYENRLAQKLSRRQPVNLRLLPSTKGTSPKSAVTFIQYDESEVGKKLIEYFEDAKGRLLLVGIPGAGKTTLSLQLVLELLNKEKNHLPVILNLARWNKTFQTLESWILEILPSETGLNISKKAAGKIIAQNRLIVLLDGFDEVNYEDRQTCLDAIGAYGEEAHRRFIISSRIDEYKEIQKDAPVNSEVEVGALSYEQLVTQLEKVDQNDGARRLLAALKVDTLLRQVVETPYPSGQVHYPIH